MADKEFTYSDVSEHNTKKDLYIVVHDKVYNASSFVDEHPYVCCPAQLAQCTSAFACLFWATSPASIFTWGNDTATVG
jgi:cytochrome b involved in lipid metabolism